MLDIYRGQSGRVLKRLVRNNFDHLARKLKWEIQLIIAEELVIINECYLDYK